MEKINLNDLSAEEKQNLREKVITYVKQGMERPQISTITGLDRKQLYRIITDYEKSESDAFSNNKKGRRSKIDLYEADVLEELTKSELFLTINDIEHIFSSVTNEKVTKQSIMNMLKRFKTDCNDAAVHYDDVLSIWREHRDFFKDKHFIEYIMPHIIYDTLIVKRNDYMIPINTETFEMSRAESNNPIIEAIAKIELYYAKRAAKQRPGPVTALDFVTHIYTYPLKSVISQELYDELSHAIQEAIDYRGSITDSYTPTGWLAENMIEYMLQNSKEHSFNFLKYILSNKLAVDLYDYSIFEEYTIEKCAPEYKQLLKTLKFYENLNLKHKPEYELIDNGKYVTYRYKHILFRKDSPELEERQVTTYPVRQHILPFKIYQHPDLPYFMIVIEGPKPYLHFFLKDITTDSLATTFNAFEHTIEEIFVNDIDDSQMSYEGTLYLVITEKRLIQLFQQNYEIRKQLDFMEDNNHFFLMPMNEKQLTDNLDSYFKNRPIS